MIQLEPITFEIDAPGVSANFKEHIYRNQGLPDKIISCRDSIFMRKFWKSLLKFLGTNISY